MSVEILNGLIGNEGLSLPKEPFEVYLGTTGMRVECYKVPGVSRLIEEKFPEMEGVFPDVLALKVPDEKPHGVFINEGEVADKTLLLETRVDQRQLTEGMPSTLGVGWQKRIDGQVRLFSEEVEGAEVAMVMPYFGEKTEFGIMVPDLKKMEKQQLAEGMVKRALVMSEPLTEDQVWAYGNPEQLRALVMGTLEHTSLWHDASGHDASDSRLRSTVKGLFTERFDQLLQDDNFLDFLQRERAAGSVAEHHGDTRPFCNLNVIRDKQGKLGAIWRDPIRQILRETGEMIEFFLTYDWLQVLGLMLARMEVEPDYQDQFKYVSQAFLQKLEDKGRIESASKLSDQEQRMLNLAIAYGGLVEIIVYHGRVASGLQVTGPKPEDYWRMIEEKSNYDFK